MEYFKLQNCRKASQISETIQGPKFISSSEMRGNIHILDYLFR